MLVPNGSKEPKIFQIKNPINVDVYTNSASGFYTVAI